MKKIKPTPKPWRVFVTPEDNYLAVFGTDERGPGLGPILWTVKRDPEVLQETWERQKRDAHLVVKLRNALPK